MNSLALLPMQISGIVIFILVVVLLVLGILMPYYVYRINVETRRMHQSLEHVESLLSRIKDAAIRDGVLVMPREKE